MSWWPECWRRFPLPRLQLREMVDTASDVPAENSGALLPTELMARVRQIQIRTHRQVNTALAGGYRSTFRGSGLEFDEVRPYQLGDDVRSIDWKVTARTGEAFVKRFQEERELTLHLIVDTSPTLDFGSGRWTKREATAHLAALIALVAIRHQDRVGLTLFGARPGLHLPARKGSQHILRIVREVLAAQPEVHRTVQDATEGGTLPDASVASDFEAVLEERLRTLHRRSLIFLMSDFLGAGGATAAGRGAPAERRRSDWVDKLARLSRDNDVIAVRVCDPLEERLPAAGLFSARAILDGAGARARPIDTRSATLRAEWARLAEERRAGLAADLGRARVDLMEITAGENVADPLAAFFHRRQARHGGRPA